MQLTKAEVHILEQLFRCRSYKEMSQDLNLSISTVRFHATNIYRKAGINTTDCRGKLMLLLRKFGRFEVSVKWTPHVETRI